MLDTKTSCMVLHVYVLMCCTLSSKKSLSVYLIHALIGSCLLCAGVCEDSPTLLTEAPQPEEL